MAGPTETRHALGKGKYLLHVMWCSATGPHLVLICLHDLSVAPYTLAQCARERSPVLVRLTGSEPLRYKNGLSGSGFRLQWSFLLQSLKAQPNQRNRFNPCKFWSHNALCREPTWWTQNGQGEIAFGERMRDDAARSLPQNRPSACLSIAL